MRTVVVGSGQVGGALRQLFAAAGDEVIVARRVPEQADEVPLDGAAALGDRVALTVPFPAVDDVVPRLGLRDGQLLIDASNPFGRPLPEGTRSGGAHVQSLAPQARVVKCFNVIGYEHMTDPVFPQGRALMPICGDDPAACEEVVALADAAGFDAVAIGGLDLAHVVETTALLWVSLARSTPQGRALALGLLRRDEPTAPWAPR